MNEDALFGNLEACRRAGLRNGVPTAFYVQAVGGFGNSYRRPDEGQLTYHMASALAYGFKWVKYWSWFVPDYGTDPENTTYNDYTDAIIGKDGKPTDLYPIATDLHNRAHTIGPVLVDGETYETVYATDNDPETGPVCRVFKLESDRPARFVRIVALKLTGGYEPNLRGHLMQISEIEVYWN